MATATSPLRMNSPEEYHDWMIYIRRRALSEDIWQYVDPDEATTLAKPIKPVPQDYYHDENHQPAAAEAEDAAAAAPASRRGTRSRRGAADDSRHGSSLGEQA